MSESNVSPRQIQLIIWEHRSDPDRLMLLYDYQTPASESPTTVKDWRPYYSFLAYNPLSTPYPEGTELFRARHSSNYPYELIDIVPMLDVYNVEEPGTYFVAYRSPVTGTSKLPFRDMHIFVEHGRKFLYP
jgi:hypothetical protein